MRTRLSRPVLSVFSQEDEEEAAWDLFTAVNELFPERFAELEALRSQPDDNQCARQVKEWTERNRISCRAVDAVAMQIAAGGDGPGESFAIIVSTDKNGNLEDPPSITASPFDETLNEFLRRAREHYREVRRWFLKRGYNKRQVKRELDHFRWLTAHLISEQTWAQITEREDLNPLNLSERTIGGEARKAARLVGISLRNTPGPRPGSGHTPRRRRRR